MIERTGYPAPGSIVWEAQGPFKRSYMMQYGKGGKILSLESGNPGLVQLAQRIPVPVDTMAVRLKERIGPGTMVFAEGAGTNVDCVTQGAVAVAMLKEAETAKYTLGGNTLPSRLGPQEALIEIERLCSILIAAESSPKLKEKAGEQLFRVIHSEGLHTQFLQDLKGTARTMKAMRATLRENSRLTQDDPYKSNRFLSALRLL